MVPSMTLQWAVLIAALITSSLSSAASADGPQIQLDAGTFIGTRNGSVDSYLGIPYVKPPTGNLRFRLPVPNDPYQGVYNATNFGPACLQQAQSYSVPENLDPEAKTVLGILGGGGFAKTSEDCLTLNVWRPSNLANDTKLPVVIWIFGGGFEVGDSSSLGGYSIVQRSIDMGTPIIYVSMNYRLSAFGFLAGAEVKAAGVANLGLRDQRQSFHWVQKYITAFGGDPSKVTIWGQSAGSDSVALHMLANHGNTEGLFRGAFMQSGPPLPYGDISKGQRHYDDLVAKAGCQNATDSLQCLREVPSSVIQDAMNSTPSILDKEAFNITWVPRADGSFLQDPPMQAVLKDYIADIPFVSGECDDEGTLYMLSQTNITTEEAVHEFIASNYFPDASTTEIDTLLKLYPQDPTQGSPFNTSTLNSITPQSKRLAALQGDLLFMSPRRFFLQERSNKQPVWSFLSKRFKSLPDFGSFHAHDLLNIYGQGELTDYLIHFVNDLNPNGNGSAYWPQYTPSNPTLMTFLDGAVPSELGKEDFREVPISYLTKLLLKYPL